jgi:hypothetical protein
MISNDGGINGPLFAKPEFSNMVPEWERIFPIYGGEGEKLSGGGTSSGLMRFSENR